MRFKSRALLGGVGVIALGVSALAGSATYDFNTDPGLNFVGNAEWRSSGGVNDSGYVALFDAINSQYAGVLLPDFDNGLIVRAFTFECELRVGNAVGNDGRPADGFSINYARASDPVVADLDQDPPVVNWNNYAIPGAPEGGTTTGLSICFDTWSGNTWPSGETDIEGIIVRVDNVTKARVPMTTRNGSCTDPTSLQTGPYNPDLGGDPSELCWAPLKVNLADNGELTVTWKGTVIVDKAQTGFLPSAGRLVFAGRTGGANENTHVDNLKITTIPADKALITGVAADAQGVTVNLDDSGQSVVNPDTVTMTVDGVAVTPLTITKSNKTSTVRWNAPTYLAAGQQLAVGVTFKDTQGVAVADSRTATVAAYALIPAAYRVPAASVNTARRGFLVRPYQTEAAQPNTLLWTEGQLLGQYGPNIADLSGASGGLYTHEGILNFNMAAPDPVGNFTVDNGYMDDLFPGFPGTTLSTGNAAVEVLTYLDFPTAGLHQLGVNSDDGFRVTAGRAPGDLLGVILGYFDGGRGASDTVFSVLIDQPGIYPIRLIWENGSGELPGNGANLEFFSVKDGQKVPVNHSSANAIKAYRESTAAGPYVSNLNPLRGATGVAGNVVITAEISHGSVQVDAASVKVKVNGVDTPATASTAAAKTTVTVQPPGGLLPSGTEVAVAIEFSDRSTPPVAYSTGWSFTVATYSVISEDLRTASGTGDAGKPGLKARVWQVEQVGSNTLVNRTHRAEQQLAGIIGPNVADLSAATGGWFEFDLINWDQDLAGNGSFGAANEVPVPGIPGNSAYPTDNVAAEIITYVEFPSAGFYGMGVNSDDGFKVTVSDTPPVHNLALVVSGAGSAAGSYHAISAPAASARQFTAGVSGKLVYMDPAQGCAAPANAAALQGNIALVDRGTCEFSTKILNAKNAGAIAVVVVNNRGLDHAEGIFPIEMGAGSAGYQDIPAVMISMPDGDKIKTGLASGLTASITPDTTPALGEFDGGRGATDTIFYFIVPNAGLYPFRCVWYEGNGGANLEWFSVTSTGAKILLNDRGNAAALKSFRARTATPQPKPTLSIAAQGGNVVVTFTGILQTAPSVEGPWSDSSAASPLTEPASSGTKFYRAKR
jgi:hypothetical protein